MKTSLIKVLHVLSDTNIGGAGSYVVSCLENCDRTKFAPALVIPKNSAVRSLVKTTDIPVIEADIAPDKSFDLRSVGVVRKIIKKGGYDIVHAHGSAFARIAAKGLCECVFTKHTLSKSGGALSKLVYRAMGGYAIAVSDTCAKNLAKLGFDKKRIFTVYNGVDDMSVPSDARRAECKGFFGIDSDKIVIGCVARFHPVKDWKTILDAAQITCSANNNVVFLLVGDGELRQPMIDYANTLGIADKCIFPGTLNDRKLIYHAMDIYILASIEETFGLSLVESWSAGLPSVVSDAAGLVEVSEDGACALVCKTGDAAAFAKNCLLLASDAKARKQLGLSALIRYKNKFLAKNFVRNVENVYINICRK